MNQTIIAKNAMNGAQGPHPEKPTTISVPALIPVTGSAEAARVVIDAIIDLKEHARAQTVALKAAHAQHLAAVKRQGETALAALKATHERAIADLAAKAAAEIDDLQRRLDAAHSALKELETLRQRLQSCVYASQLLVTAVKGL